MCLPRPPSTLFPYTTLFRSADGTPEEVEEGIAGMTEVLRRAGATAIRVSSSEAERQKFWAGRKAALDRKSTRLNSSHRCISYAVFCLKKKKQAHHSRRT